MKFPAWIFGLGRVGVGNRKLGRAEFVYVYLDAIYVNVRDDRSDGRVFDFLRGPASRLAVV